MSRKIGSMSVFGGFRRGLTLIWTIVMDAFDKRVSRQTIWLNLLISFASFVFINIFLVVPLSLVFNFEQVNFVLRGLALMPVLYVVLVLSLVGHVGRLHDLGYSGWWWLIHLIPLGSLFVWLFVLSAEGDPNENRYGAPPPDRLRAPTSDNLELGTSTLDASAEAITEESKPRPRAFVFPILGAFSIWFVWTADINYFEDHSAKPRVVADYENLEISDVFKRAYYYQHVQRTPSYYAEYAGTQGSLKWKLRVRSTTNCTKNTDLEVIVSLPPNTGDESYVQTRAIQKISEALDRSFFKQVDRIVKERVDAYSDQLVSVLDVVQTEFTGEKIETGMMVTRIIGDDQDSRLLPTNTLNVDGAVEYEGTLISSEKKIGQYIEFDSTEDDWFTRTDVAVEPILFEGEYKLWEFTTDDMTYLKTEDGVELWHQILTDEGVFTLSLQSFEALRDIPCELDE